MNTKVTFAANLSLSHKPQNPIIVSERLAPARIWTTSEEGSTKPKDHSSTHKCALWEPSSPQLSQTHVKNALEMQQARYSTPWSLKAWCCAWFGEGTALKGLEDSGVLPGYTLRTSSYRLHELCPLSRYAYCAMSEWSLGLNSPQLVIRLIVHMLCPNLYHRT